jgi:hypothetical protein
MQQVLDKNFPSAVWNFKSNTGQQKTIQLHFLLLIYCNNTVAKNDPSFLIDEDAAVLF